MNGATECTNGTTECMNGTTECTNGKTECMNGKIECVNGTNDSSEGTATAIQESVQKFYATAKDSSDLGAVTCCPSSAVPSVVEDALKLIHPDVLKSSFGCGLPFPSAIDGCAILDLGSGAGRDSFLLAYLAGPQGRVLGIDMTPAMLDKARSMIPYHEEKFGFSNVEFKQGFLEKLDEIEGCKPETFDIIISNCVINLCSDKPTVLKHAFNLLKPGGELCFSDVYAEKSTPDSVRDHAAAWNEGFGGALEWKKFLHLTQEIGFLGPYIMSSSDFVPVSEELKSLTEGLKYWARTVRLFKPGYRPINDPSISLSVTYLGTIAECKEDLRLAQNIDFKANVSESVSEDTFRALRGSRFSDHFRFDESQEF